MGGGITQDSLKDSSKDSPKDSYKHTIATPQNPLNSVHLANSSCHNSTSTYKDSTPKDSTPKMIDSTPKDSATKDSASLPSIRTISKDSAMIPLFYKLYVLCDKIPQDYKDLLQETIAPFGDFASLEFIYVSGVFVEEWQKLHCKSHFAKEFFYKLLPASYFINYDKIIISDVDVVFLGDVSQSFLAFDCKEDIYISGVRANNPNKIFPLNGWKSGYKKFNKMEFEAIKYGVGAGYLIANLAKWREDNLQSKFLIYLKNNSHKLVLAEQDVLNIICYPKIATLSPAHIVGNAMWEYYGKNWETYIPEVYSKSELDDARNAPIQLHYIGHKKPWNYPSEPKSDIWYRYLCKTPFLNLYLQTIESTIINNYIKTTFMYRVRHFIKCYPLFLIDIRAYMRVAKKLWDRISKLG